MRPNILFVFSDQHRWSDLGCYGNKEVQSPYLDEFARSGTTVEACLSNCPLCVPARGSLLTGLYPMKHRAVSNDLPIDPSANSVAHALNGKGYHTGYMGKWHLGGIPRDQAIEQERRLGFTEWKVCNCSHDYLNSYYYDEKNRRHEINGYDAETYTTLAVDFIRRNKDEDQPWALWLSWGPPHDPYFAVPEKYLARYDEQTLSLRPNVPDTIVHSLGHRWTREEARRNLKGYYAHITALDEQFGRLVKTLEESGQLENTIVVYTSDHGDQLGSNGYTNKQLPYEESVRVPLIVRGPGIQPGARTSAMIGTTDLPVTVLSLAGVELDGADGRDLSSIFSDNSATGLDECYLFDLVPCHQSARRGTGAWRAVRTRRYTYACSDNGEPALFFDNLADPAQRNNLVADRAYADILSALQARVKAFADEYDALIPWPNLLKENGLLDEWNKSQRYFGEPETIPAIT
ncbi:sulfatase [Ruficoccus amylovorans]|uniref:Sulfatase n=1 Tax=Ruficoccus amylovorans TaxID=1804625 RepID=A0A842HHZ2_9BACT|nr:sulfatase [Ruficoccus amylovorans]MBC2595157.1 sulfatase [Ruficoccus amylovorans]